MGTDRAETAEPEEAGKVMVKPPAFSPSSFYPIYLHPLVAFASVWLLVCFLYSLNFSHLILFTAVDVMRLEIILLLSATIGFFFSRILPDRFVMPVSWQLSSEIRTVNLLDRRLVLWFRVWCSITLIEIMFSGGLPIVWVFTGSSKTYFDFGIPTIHGFMNSLLLAICLVRLAMGIKYRRRKDFLYAIFIVAWSIIAITRQLMMVFLLEAAVVYCTYRGVRIKRLRNAILSLLSLIYIFGALGDFRTGAEAFRLLAQPTESYPDWLPSGFLWFYMYLVTPVNNLLYTFHTTHPTYDWRFPNTAAQILPSVIRNLFYSKDQLSAANGDLITSAFNVSTAFAAPFQDFGLVGVIGWSFLISLLSGLYWKKQTFRDRLCYAVLCQCLLLTVFYNHFLVLPVITQLVWIYVFSWRTEGEVANCLPASSLGEIHAAS